MVYGELMVQDRHDYNDSAIFKTWLCFGVSIQANDPSQNKAIAEDLRTAGYVSYAHENMVVISPNDHLFDLFKTIGIRTLAEYRPKAINPEQWAEHDGTSVPTFPSLHAYFESDWCHRFFTNPDTGALGEGMVVASALNGRMFKVKHGGEDCGNVPDKLYDGIEMLEKCPEMDKELDVFKNLQKIIKCKHKVVEKEKPKPKAKTPAAVDEEATKAWESALTKEDSLDD